MTYRIIGLEPEPFAALFALDDAALAARGARRVTASASRGFPCRVSLRDADEGDELILLHHTSHDVATPYRSAYAIYVRSAAQMAAEYIDETPPVFEGRPLGFRAFDAEGMLRDARLAAPGEEMQQSARCSTTRRLPISMPITPRTAASPRASNATRSTRDAGR